MTSVDPSDSGKDIWDATLDTFFLGDTELMGYVQEIVGLAAIGKVYIEALILALLCRVARTRLIYYNDRIAEIG